MTLRQTALTACYVTHDATDGMRPCLTQGYSWTQAGLAEVGSSDAVGRVVVCSHQNNMVCIVIQQPKQHMAIEHAMYTAE